MKKRMQNVILILGILVVLAGIIIGIIEGFKFSHIGTFYIGGFYTSIYVLMFALFGFAISAVSLILLLCVVGLVWFGIKNLRTVK